ncbi:MAG: YCF48-related protein [Caldimonas sp.]
MAGTDRARGASLRHALSSAFCTALLATLLAACGGGGDGGGGLSTGTTPLPQTLVVTLPPAQQALGATLSFSSNADDPANALTFRWDFGDGATSALAAPTHAYAKAGVFSVRLTVSNEAGNALSTTGVVAIADFAIVSGKACSGAGSTGWCWQRPLPQGNAIFDYAFVDDTHGWAVGEGGSVLATADAGVSWQAQVSGTGLDLGRVSFANAQVGWVAGSFGEVLKTADGGATWQRLSFGQDEPAQGIHATDISNAWVTTLYGTAYVTKDGGSQWRRIVAPAGAFKLAMVSGTDVWALPYYNDGTTTTLSHSLDGGVTWMNVALPPMPAGFTSSPQDLQFADATHGLLTWTEFGLDADSQMFVSRDVAWRTVDGGASWLAVGAPPGGTSGDPYRLVDATTLFVSSFLSPLQRSSDGGATWQDVPLPLVADSYIASYETYSAQRLIVTDGAGRVYLSVDGGARWNLRGAGAGALAGLNGIWFFDSREGMALAYDGSSVRTSDGGRTWATAAPASSFGWRRPQFLADASIGWVVSGSGTIARSTDKGRSWVVPGNSPLVGVTDFHFIDDQHGWAVSPYGTVGSAALYSSIDGGSSWQSAAGTSTLGGLVSVRFGDLMHGAAVGPAGIAMVTVDGGTSWIPRPTGIASNLRRITFADAMTAVAVGDNGAVVRSTDQGRTWTRVASPTANNLNDVRFVSATVGHAAGELGTLITTRDGGLSWTLSSTGARPALQSVFFVDEQTGWITGDNGSILATATGGR